MCWPRVSFCRAHSFLTPNLPRHLTSFRQIETSSQNVKHERCPSAAPNHIRELRPRGHRGQGGRSKARRVYAPSKTAPWRREAGERGNARIRTISIISRRHEWWNWIVINPSILTRIPSFAPGYSRARHDHCPGRDDDRICRGLVPHSTEYQIHQGGFRENEWNSRQREEKGMI